MGIEYFLQQLVNGICLGGMYALMSVGYSLVYSIMNFFPTLPTEASSWSALMWAILHSRR